MDNMIGTIELIPQNAINTHKVTARRKLASSATWYWVDDIEILVSMPDFAFARLEKIEKAISADAGFSIDLLMHNEVAVSSILYVHFSVTKNRERIRAIAVWDEQGVEVKL